MARDYTFGNSITSLSTIATLTAIADHARKSVRDAKTLENLLVEAGEFNPGTMVGSLVKSRTLDLAEMMQCGIQYPTPLDAVYSAPSIPILTVPPLHDSVADDWRFDGELSVDLD